MSQPEPIPSPEVIKALTETLTEAGKRISAQFTAGIKRLNDHLREVRENPAIRDSYRELERERQYERMLANQRWEARRWLRDYTEQTRASLGLPPE